MDGNSRMNGERNSKSNRDRLTSTFNDSATDQLTAKHPASKSEVSSQSSNRRAFLQSCFNSSCSAPPLASAIVRKIATPGAIGQSLGVAALGVLTGGCIASSTPSAPEKTWGRRGFSPGRFLKPRAITIDQQDNLYIVDTTGRIQVFDSEGLFLRQWKTPQTQNGRPTGLHFTSGAPSAGILAAPTSQSNDHTLDSSRLLVADTHYYRMLSYTPDGKEMEQENIGGTAGFGPGEFAFVTDIACDQFGARYIGEYNASDRIQKFDNEGNFICQWGGSGRQPGSFLRPQSLLIRDNVLWVVDSCNHRIQRFDITENTPKLIDIWGQAGEKRGQFYYPYDLAIASDGTVVVVEYKNNRLQRFSEDGKWIATWGGPGFEPGKLNQPWGVVIDSKDQVHILDSSNHRVQRIQLPA